jgi:protease II
MSIFERFLRIESAGGPSWHPSEQKITFTYNSPGNYHVYNIDIIKRKQAWAKRLTFEVDRCTAPKHLEDGSIIFMRDYGGDENFQIGRITKERETSWLTSDLKTKHIIDVISRTGFYFNANIKDKSTRDVYKYSITNENEPYLIFKADNGVMRASCTTEDEKKIILEKIIGNNEQELFLYEQGKTTSITKSISGNEKIRWNAVRFIDEDNILVATDYKSDYRRLSKLSLNGEFSDIQWIEKNLKSDITETFWCNASPFTYFLNNEEGYSSLYKAHFKSNESEIISSIKLPIKGVAVFGDERNFDNSSALSPDGKFIALTLSSPTEPTNIWIIDTQTLESWKATDVSLAGLNKNKFSEATLHRFNSYDGLSVPFFRYLPKGTSPINGWPCVFEIHGGPESQYRPSFDTIVQFLISAGFAVIAPNIRGSDGYGRNYLDMDNVEKRLDSIKDIKYLAVLLKDPSFGINHEKLVIYGGSYGGFSVLSAMTEHPELWLAGVDLFGISNFVTFLQNTAPWRRTLRETEYGSLEKDREVLEKISPINKVDNIKAPLFIIQGDRDERVPLSESLQIYKKLEEKGIPVKMIRFPDEGHGVVKIENKIKAYSEMLEWLKKII